MKLVPTKDIIIIENFLTDEELSALNSVDYQSLSIPTELKKDYNLVLALPETLHSITEEIHTRAFTTLSEILGNPVSTNDAKEVVAMNNNISVIKVGGHMSEHHDEESKNAYGVVIYVNDNYEGGELVYTNIGLSLKPKAGMMLVHPASEYFSHKVNTVSGNDRYVITTFINKEKHKIIL